MSSVRPGRPLVLAAPDKFRGSATAKEIATAFAAGAEREGFSSELLPLADGGEGTLEVLGGPNEVTTVSGPLGEKTAAGWRLHDEEAVIELAAASGLSLVGGPAGNDPVRASSVGTGELINAAIARGARRIVVALGGSATTDGGRGLLEVVDAEAVRACDLVVACDVRTSFFDAARQFAPQKGATEEQVRLLSERLESLAAHYRAIYGADITDLPGSGAAGGVGGALALLGGRLVDGFSLVAGRVGFFRRVAEADVVLTGEGRLDETSFQGKVVGRVIEHAGELALPVGVIVGENTLGDIDVAIASLVELYGERTAFDDTLLCARNAATQLLRRLGNDPRTSSRLGRRPPSG